MINKINQRFCVQGISTMIAYFVRIVSSSVNHKFIVLICLILFLYCMDTVYGGDATDAYVPRFAGMEPGEISLSLEASQFTGEFTTSLPIELLPSTGNIQKNTNLGLRYRSGGGNTWVGRGWELEVGYIAKINKFGANNANNPFFLVLNDQIQELVNIGGGEYRTKIESFMRVKFDGSVWQVWDKGGTEYRFEIFGGGKWVLTKINNLHGISLIFDYDKPNSEEIYLKEIRYPSGIGLVPYCKVVFVLEDRDDKQVSYYFGSLSRINRRLKEIQVLAEGQLQKKYVLSYLNNTTSKISLLSSVTEYGKDGSSLPPSRFSYHQPLRDSIFEIKGNLFSSQPTCTYNPSYDTSLGMAPAGLNMAIIDLNGDAMPDFIWSKLKNSDTVFKSDWIVFYNNGNGFSQQENKWLDSADSSFYLQTPQYTVYESISLGQNALLIDMNKDGLPDLVYSKLATYINICGYYYDTFDIMVRYNTGNSFSGEVKFCDDEKLYKLIGQGCTANVEILKLGYNVTLADMNGDGLPDLVYNRQPQYRNACAWYVRLNTGNGFSDEEKSWLAYNNAYFEYQLNNRTEIEYINVLQNSMLIDMNNDGIADLVYNDYAQTISNNDNYHIEAPSYNFKVRYGTGSGFSQEVVTFYSNAPVYFCWNDIRYIPVSVRLGANGTLVDVNSDGLPDLVFNKYEKGEWGGYPPALWMVCFNLGNKFSEPVKMLDSLGYYFDSGHSYGRVLTYNAFFSDINKDGVADLIYPKFSEWVIPGQVKFNLAAYLNKTLLSVDLLSSYVTNYGGSTDVGYISSAYFDNQRGLPFILPVLKSITKNPGVGASGTTTYNYGGGRYDMSNREFRGFRHAQITDHFGYITNIFYHQDNSKLGKIEQQEDLVNKVVNTYSEDGSLPYFTPLAQEDIYTDSKCMRNSYEYDNYGNITKKIYYGDIDLEGDEKSVLLDFSLNPSLWLLNLVSRERIFPNKEATGIPVSEEQYVYDNNSSYADSPLKGDLTKTRKYLDTLNDYVQTTSTYDIYGNQISKTDAKGYATTLGYDSIYNLFLTSLINPKGHTESYSYCMPTDNKGLFGQMKSKTDLNGNIINFEYDGFGRKTKIIGPYDEYSAFGSESYEYGMSGPGSNYLLTRTTEESGTSNCFTKIDILDGFGRTIQAAKESEDEDTFVYINNYYNPRGELEKVSLPYFNEGGLRKYYLSINETLKWMQYSYDAIGRIITITKPDLTTIQNSYSGWTTIVLDENGHQKVQTKDAFGRLSVVKERNGEEEYSTAYNYDTMDNLVLITDHFGNKFEFYYDTLKRKIRMNDPDLGVWTYRYDNNGNLIESVNGNGDVINYNYDELNRLLSKDYAARVEVEITYAYDEQNSANGIGRRTSMSDLSGNSRWYYDKEGRIVKLEKTVDSNVYVVDWVYDAMGRVKSITYPNSRKTEYEYNNGSLIERVPGFVDNIDYNASAQATLMISTNSLISRFDYYMENQRLKSIFTGSLQDLLYEYDKVGNIVKIADSVHSFIKDYSYDAIDRLVLGDGNSYEYNAIGNTTKVNGVSYAYSLSKPHALISDGVNSYSYDGCGNMISGAGRSITYDAENRPIRITKGGIVTEFVYDGDGKRVKKLVSNGLSRTATIYIEDLYEKEMDVLQNYP